MSLDSDIEADIQKPPQPSAHHHHESHFNSSEAIRDIVIGLSDGLTVPFALAAGLAGAVTNIANPSHLVVTAGLAEIAAGSIAMGLGGYLASRGDTEHFESERRREEREVVERPADEEAEIYEIFEEYGVSREAATPVLRSLQANHPAYVDFMMRFELGLEEPAPGRALRSASTIAFSYIAGGAIPLAPAPLSPEDLMVQSCAEASPAKWHLAHTSWFFETFVLRDFLAGYRDFHPDFHWLFNSYYNSLGDMPAKSLRASFSRPPLADILAYRAHVDAAIARLLESQPEYPANAEAVRRIALGLEHEQQHQELIATDIKHALFTNPLHPAYREPSCHRPAESIAPPLDWVAFAPGLTEIGFAPRPRFDLDSFCFDNETPRHTVFLAPFSLATRPVTCAEYLAFMDDNGYDRPELWLSEGWTTIRAEAGRPRSTGSATPPPTPAGASTPCAAGSRSTTSPRRPSVTSASSRPTPTRAGPRATPPAVACPPSSSGSTPPRNSKKFRPHPAPTSSNPARSTPPAPPPSPVSFPAPFAPSFANFA
jgi:VIT1/CCC1 family predicted Fe2+/Mn2+ transporter